MSPVQIIPVKIEATQYAIEKIFSNDFTFTIPLYQRPYAWTTEQAGELIEDLITFLGDGNEPIDELNPYFLGSIVLIKGHKADAEVVDGQQRLATLTILLSALRSLEQPEHTAFLTNFLYQEGNPFLGTPNHYRLTLAERDSSFFQKYIQDKGGINELENLNSADLSDSCKNIKENGLLFLKQLKELPESQRFRLAQFIIQRCFLVVVSTPDIDSAYRIFSVLNDRGLDLSLTDILKSEIIGVIPDLQRETYSSKWEKIELDLNRDSFKDLFSHIRMIYRKTKLAGKVIAEIRDYVKPSINPQQFINEVLSPLADAFYDIKNSDYESDNKEAAAKINQLFQWSNKIDNSDWIPPAILYLSRNNNTPDKLVKFFTDLERLAAGMMILRVNINERIVRYSKLLTAIEEQIDLYTPKSPLQLTPEERTNIIQTLDGDLYLIQKIRHYVLLRIDTALSDGGASYNYPTITIEHVLPQNPANGGWTVFSATNRKKYVHRLGNLVLLSRRKNSEAQNYDFKTKKEKYFTSRSGVTPFVLTTQVLKENTWTPVVIERRQKELIDTLKEVWRL